MKKIILSTAIMLIALMPAMLQAQTPIDKLYEKYAGQEGFTSINISPGMFQMLSDLDTDDSTEGVKEAQNVMDQLKSLKMLVYEPKEGQKFDFMTEVKKSVKLGEYLELMSIREENTDIRFLVKKTKDGHISELLMLVDDDNEGMILSMTGNIDMNTISKIGKSMDVKGLENLEKLDQK
ncbi:MAG: DUF4252 domain-containing protein [Bacteroidales bacterium]|nr:DUF4252 domain-containing protein [Bacteroidales bacterium]